ncbi:MAG TPA: hypothetical protein VFB15_13100 [Candidatus Binataceae bacterium]|jgi:hypothetical protein|nr:hypothetical protein [Candidatus Binataceae bacterium]
MTTLATVLAITSGFFLARFPEAPLKLIATSLAIDAALAPLIAVIAARRGRQWPLWAVVGFLFGAWALLCILLLGPPRTASHNGTSPPAEAA